MPNYFTEKASLRSEADGGQAEPALLLSGSWQRLLLARWLRGEAERALGNLAPARNLLEETAHNAEVNGQPQIAERCFSSLGALALIEGNLEVAEENFKRAIDLTEQLRAPIPGEEFRTAFSRIDCLRTTNWLNFVSSRATREQLKSLHRTR